MKIYAPKYYSKFKCIANKCKHSCCIGWEIDIDPLTMNKYASMSNSYSKNINESIVHTYQPHFSLNEFNKCPHLKENGLCNIIINCGEEYICDICREHPRFYNFTNQGKEVGVGMSCEAACSLILSFDDFDEIIEIDSNNDYNDTYEYDSLSERKTVYEILKDNTLTIDEKVEKLSNRYNIDWKSINIIDVISNLEYLYDEHRQLISNIKTIEWNICISAELTRILAYFVYRHTSEACSYDDFCVSLAFSILCTGIISTLSNKDTINDIARILSEEIEYSQDNIDSIKSIFDSNIYGDLYEDY